MNRMSHTLIGLLAIVLVSCSPDVPKLIPEPKIVNEKVDIDSGAEVFEPKLDILFVVDDSGSMQTHQSNLSNNIFGFVNGFVQRQDIDYHVGVVTTSMERYSWTNAAPCCGELVGPSGVKFVTPSTPNLTNILSANLRVGTNGSGSEMIFGPIMAALSPNFIGGINAGFYRPEAHLAIVVISDAEDQTPRVRPMDTWQFLLGLKGRPERILSFGVIVPSLDTTGCDRDDSTARPKRIEEFLQLSGQGLPNVFSLCDPKFGDNLVQMADLLVKSVGNIIYLSRSPILETIKVTYGTQTIDPHPNKGWTYDPRKNAIILGGDIEWSAQPRGTRVRVNYDAAHYKPNLK
jgi:hypothetical protein